MKSIDDIAVVIQARLGSQRIPQKMIKCFSGTTLTDISLEKIKKLKSISKDNFFLSVYEQELVDIGEKHDLNIFSRSEASANSEGTPMTEMYEWWDKLPYKYCVLINPCAPFLKEQTIDNFMLIIMGLQIIIGESLVFFDVKPLVQLFHMWFSSLLLGLSVVQYACWKLSKSK